MELGLEESGYASPFASPLYRWDDKRWALLFTLTREETGGKKHPLVRENCIAIR